MDPASQNISSIILTSETLPSVITMNDGMFPRKSSKVCSLIAPLLVLYFAQGNTDNERSIVLESRALGLTHFILEK